MSAKIVISASRRTDIPAFYMDWFMARVDKGFFEIVNPYNQKKTIVPATHDEVHTIVFWSKNFARFIDSGFGEQLKKKGFHLFFNFTINSNNLFLEPNIPPLENRIRQADTLCKMFGPETVSWRFDPVCFYTLSDGSVENNLKDFSEIAEKLASFGILRCITSFMDHYAKIDRRPKPYAEFEFHDPDMDTKIKILQKMESTIVPNKMKLYICCEKKVLSLMPPETTVQNSSCIPNRLLMELFGGRLSLKKDTGQRIKQGCGCMVSKDIGLYKQQPCFHNCLFCYANPRYRK